MKELFFLAIICLLVLPSSELCAQRLSKSDWTQKVENDAFIEGTYSLPVSSALTLISFHSTFKSFKDSKDKSLYFKFHSPKTNNFLLKVQERKIKDYYMLESQPGKIKKGENEVGPWKMDDFVKSLKIQSKNLAVICRFNENDRDYILPVSVLDESGRDNSDEYKMLFRLSKKIAKGNCKVYLGEHKGKLPESKLVQSSKVGRHPGGSVFQVTVDKANLKGYQGWVTVHLSLSPSGSRKKTSTTFYFYHI